MSIRTRRNSRRLIAAAAAVAVAASTFIATSAGPAGATTALTPSAERYSGANRFETAAAVATSTRASGCATVALQATVGCKTFNQATAVVIVNGRTGDGADGLAAAALAGQYKAPILLVEQNEIPAATLTALNTLLAAPFGNAAADTAGTGINRIFVVGGASAVSASVVDSLSALKSGVSVTRVGGATRYETAINVALAVSAAATPTTGPTKAILAVGDNWPDALAASALAFGGIGTKGVPSPILLNNGATLRADVAAALTAMNTVNEVLVVGGTTVVPEAVLTSIRALKNANGGSIGAVRAGGANRFETAVAASASSSAFTTNALGVATDVTAVVLANGQSSVGPWDALSAGPLAGMLDAALLLTEAAAPPAATAAWHQAAASSLAKIYAVGGTAVISDAAATAAVAAATPLSPVLQSAAWSVSASAFPAFSELSVDSGVNVVTLSAIPTGPFAGVLGNDFKLYTSVAASPVSAGTTLTVSTGAGAPGGQLLIVGPNEDAINGTLLSELQSQFTSAGFTLAIDASVAADGLTVGNLRSATGGISVGVWDETDIANSVGTTTVKTDDGETGGTLTLTFSSFVTSQAALTFDIGRNQADQNPIELEVAQTTDGKNIGTCTLAGVCTFTLVNLEDDTDQHGLRSLLAATAKPELRYDGSSGGFANSAGLMPPTVVVALTIS